VKRLLLLRIESFRSGRLLVATPTSDAAGEEEEEGANDDEMTEGEEGDAQNQPHPRGISLRTVLPGELVGDVEILVMLSALGESSEHRRKYSLSSLRRPAHTMLLEFNRRCARGKI